MYNISLIYFVSDLKIIIIIYFFVCVENRCINFRIFKNNLFLNIFVIACTVYAAFMLIIGIMKIHDYEFGKFVGTTVFTVIGMIITVFLIFLIFLLSQQVFGWVKTVYIEMIYR